MYVLNACESCSNIVGTYVRLHVYVGCLKGFLTAVILSEKLISVVVVAVVIVVRSISSRLGLLLRLLPPFTFNEHMTRKRRDGPGRSLPNCQC